MTIAPRLLAGIDPSAGPVSWAAHLERHGAPPVHEPARRPRLDLIDLVEASGLLGHGGAGFPTGRKMRTVADGRGRAVVVANGMEGEPTAGKDALLLRHAPHLVLDGVELAAAAVGADRAHVAVHRGAAGVAPLRAALAERPARRGLDVVIHEVPANYVASEESALVHWLQGGEAKPLHVPPRPFERGVDGRPTLINNVETLAHLALIARHGSDWFREVGTDAEPGTLLVSLSGAVRRPGVTEVPFGTTIGDLLAAAGGPTEPLAGLVVGGYFGTWVDPVVADGLPLTHAALRAEGGGLGAGIVVGLPASACPVAETAHVLTYLADQSAGQCGPCVKGLPSLAGALVDLAHGRWSSRRDEELNRWLGVITGRGACRHPDGAVRFAASLLRVFPDDVAAHQRGTPCPGAAHRRVLPVGAALTRSWR